MSDSVSQLIEKQADVLAEVSDSPKLDAQILMTMTLGKSRAWLFTHDDEHISCKDRTQFLELIHRRLGGEPIAYIIGYRGFWQRDFKVDPSTLIPRPETELLIEILLERFDQESRTVLDLGTGTGAIAITLAAERPAWHVTAVDIDAQAVEIARTNAQGLANIVIDEGNWFENLDQRFDIIVSNPPYIAEGDPHLQQLTHEPVNALVSGSDGLHDIRHIVAEAQRYLTPGGCLVLEHGYDQQEAIVDLLVEAGLAHTETFKDLQGQPRAVLATGWSNPVT